MIGPVCRGGGAGILYLRAVTMTAHLLLPDSGTWHPRGVPLHVRGVEVTCSDAPCGQQGLQ